jgi:hypothetical protein
MTFPRPFQCGFCTRLQYKKLQNFFGIKSKQQLAIQVGTCTQIVRVLVYSPCFSPTILNSWVLVYVPLKLASLSNTDSSLGTKQRSQGLRSGGWRRLGHNHHVVFSQKRRFADAAEFQWESLAALNSIFVEEFRQCFYQWEQRWDCCMQSQGEPLGRPKNRWEDDIVT